MKSKTRIVYLHPHFTISGGAGTYVLETARLLAECDFDVVIVCIRADQKLVASSGVTFVELGGAITSSLFHWMLLPYFLWRMCRRVRGLQPDIIFPQAFPANWWGFVYKWAYRDTPSIWLCHEPSAFIHSRDWMRALPSRFMRLAVHALNPLLKQIDVHLSRWVDVVLANSEYTRRYAQKVYPHLKSRIQVTKLGVDHAKFYPPMKPEKRPRRIITIGRLSRFKNIEVILDALKILADRGDSVSELVIVGRGEEAGRLAGHVEKLGLSNRVRFWGYASDAELRQLLQTSRACVLASVEEPFGLVVVEAMACGAPAIVVNRGGPAETVIDGASGFHVPPLDRAALADRLQSVLHDERTFERLSEGAIARSQEYSWRIATQDVIRTALALCAACEHKEVEPTHEAAHG